jgi:DNA modification methylase
MIYNEDCLDKLKELDDNSVDSIVTDPPYGLSFMGKKWDYDVPSIDIWIECLRVLKPGGHLLAFAGSRTYHRMAVRIEDAGFEIRDQIMWIYGSGFPKSHNIGKAVDKQGGNSLGKEVADLVKKKRLEIGLSTIQLAELGKFYGKTNHGGSVSNWETGRGRITPEQFNKLIEILNLENNPIIETKREVIGKQTNIANKDNENTGRYQWNTEGQKRKESIDITKGNSRWEGWGTALKPAHEPIVMARKPFKGTVVNNVLEWGTGGINIDASRIENENKAIRITNNNKNIYGGSSYLKSKTVQNTSRDGNPSGRFPANIIFDEEAGKILDEQSGISKSSNTKIIRKKLGSFGMPNDQTLYYSDKGGASRFFYCPKTSKKDRNEGCSELEEKEQPHSTNMKCANCNKLILSGNGDSCKCENKVEVRHKAKNHHPTVKPTDLMLYLIRLVTPERGITLDPFMGSGSTGKAAVRGGFDFIGIEREKEYIEIAKARIKYEQENQKPDSQIKLF